MNSEKHNMQILTTFVVCIVQFITPFMMSGVGVALPSIGVHFSASAFQLSLAEMVYILGVSLFLMPAGQAGDILGRKKIFMIGLTGFVFTTFCLAMSGTMEIFLVIRFFQGVFVSLITATSIAILSSVIPPHRRGRSMGIVVASVYAGLSAGPAIGGYIVFHIGWKALFLITGGMGLCALGLSLSRLKGEWRGAPGKRFDYAGTLLYMGALGCLVTGIIGPNISNMRVLLITGGIGGLAFFLLVESKAEFPLLDIKMILRHRILGFTVMATFINYAASFGIIFFFSLYLQGVKGLSADTAGMLLIIQTLVQCVLSPLAGRLADRTNPARIATMGMGLCTAGLFCATRVHLYTSISMVAVIFLLLGTGFGFFSSPNMTVIMNSVPEKDYGQASSLAAAMRTLGMLTCMMLSSILISRYMGDTSVNAVTAQLFINTLQKAMLIFAGMGIAGICLSMGRIVPYRK